MSKFLADLGAFLWTVGGYWYAWVGVVAFFGAGAWSLLYKDRPMPSLIGWPIAVILLLAAFFTAWREERTRADALVAQNADERGRTTLHLIFDKSKPTFVHPLPPEHSLGRGGTMYRVGVKNSGTVVARNVSLRLIAAQPGATNLPAALRRMHDQSKPPGTSWTIKPGATEYFDVLTIPFGLSPAVQEEIDSLEPHMFINFADPVYPWMPVRPGALVLEADADNVATRIRAAFRIGEPVKEGDGQQVDVGFEVYATASGSTADLATPRD